MIWTKVQLKKHKTMIMGTFYMPHRNSEDMAELKKSLEEVSKNRNQDHILLTGDFNCPDINWNQTTLGPKANDSLVQQELIDITTEAQLTQIHDQATREDNILDLVFTSNPSLVKNSASTPGISDHCILATDVEIEPQRVKEKPRRVFQWNKAMWTKIETEMEKTLETVTRLEKENAGIEEMWTEFKSSVQNAVQKFIPSKLQKRNTRLPWVKGKIQKMTKKKNRLHKQAKQTKNWKNFRFFQKECRREIRKQEVEFINNKIEQGLREKNQKPFWKYIKARRQDSTGVAPLKNGPYLESSSSGKARVLLKQFCSVFTKENNSTPANILGNPFPEAEPLNIEQNGIEKLLKNLNSSKATGPDNIPTQVLKNCAKQIAPTLTIIFRHSVQTGNLPSDWLSANIAAVFKKGDKNKAENYRPVSLTSVTCKLLEHVISRHLRNHFDKYNILTDRNHGFRTGHSCESQLLTTTHDLFSSLEKGKQVDIAVLDLSKAFDTVPHLKLLSKLDHYGIKGPIHTWITHFLTKRKMKVLIEGESSEEAVVESGVPQGTVLGPLLFLCHLNDLPDSVNATVRLFADDCLLYKEIECIDDQKELQKDIDNLGKWAENWGMKFNATKCQILQIKPKHRSLTYKMCGVPLQVVSDCLYLGVNLSHDLSWKHHINQTTKKASSTVGFLRRNFRNCPQECKKLAYISLVRSKLEYAATVWDPFIKNEIEKLERVQRQAARFIKNDYRSRDPGCITRMLQELGLPLLETRRKDQRLKLLAKINSDQLPAIPPSSFLKPANLTRRRIKPKNHQDFEVDNILQRHFYNNNSAFEIPPWKNLKSKHSFFIRTPQDWNSLTDKDIIGLTRAASPAQEVSPVSGVN